VRDKAVVRDEREKEWSGESLLRRQHEEWFGGEGWNLSAESVMKYVERNGIERKKQC
jgi:hypothetical protein